MKNTVNKPEEMKNEEKENSLGDDSDYKENPFGSI